MSKARIFLAVFYALLALIGIGLCLGGGFLLWANSFMKDGDGFYTTQTVELKSDSHAITSYPTDIKVHQPEAIKWLTTVEIKINAEDNKDKGIFVGIAPEKDLREYLSGVEHDQIVKADIKHPLPLGEPEIEYKNIPGTSSPAEPAEQDFWIAQASGRDTQDLQWNVESGVYSVALMNEDGSTGVDVSASIGAKVPVASGLGLWLTIAGLVLVLLSFFFLYITVSRSNL
ncbi:MAG: hypothetical protein ACLFN4_05670 [Candidatus Acetothermia bacterium]